MLLDQPGVVELHHLDEIHLIAGWSFARILPHERLAVREIRRTEESASRWLSPGHLVDERLDLLAPPADAAPRPEHMRDHRALDDRIRGIERDERVPVVVGERLVPFPVDAF